MGLSQGNKGMPRWCVAGGAGRSPLQAGDTKGLCRARAREAEGKEPRDDTARPGHPGGHGPTPPPAPGPQTPPGLTWNFLKMRSGLKYSWKGVMNSSCCGDRQSSCHHPPPSASPGPRPAAPGPPPRAPLTTAAVVSTQAVV